MTDDLSSWFDQQQQPQKRNPKAALPLPMEIIRDALALDPTSPSHLRWKTRSRHHFSSDRDWKIWNTRYAGKNVESVLTVGCGKKYWKLTINSIPYRVHRVVYTLVHGIDPGNLHIDHIDGNGQNNDPGNLRLATNSENGRNRGANRNSTTGIKGVYYDSRRGKFYALIGHHGRLRYLGYFSAIEDAESAYTRAAAELHGEFAKTA